MNWFALNLILAFKYLTGHYGRPNGHVCTKCIFLVYPYIKLQNENTPHGNIGSSQISCFLSKMYTLHITLYHNDSLNRARSLVKRQLQWNCGFSCSDFLPVLLKPFSREKFVWLTYRLFLMLVTHNSDNQIKRCWQQIFLFFIFMFCAYYVFEMVSYASLSFKITCTHFQRSWLNPLERLN